jgi:hypothetical protein
MSGYILTEDGAFPIISDSGESECALLRISQGAKLVTRASYEVTGEK